MHPKHVLGHRKLSALHAPRAQTGIIVQAVRVEQALAQDLAYWLHVLLDTSLCVPLIIIRGMWNALGRVNVLLGITMNLFMALR